MLLDLLFLLTKSLKAPVSSWAACTSVGAFSLHVVERNTHWDLHLQACTGSAATHATVHFSALQTAEDVIFIGDRFRRDAELLG